MNTIQTSQTLVREDDILTHIADDNICSLFRNGVFMKLPWNALTDREKRDQIEAQRRAEHCALFRIYE